MKRQSVDTKTPSDSDDQLPLAAWPSADEIDALIDNVLSDPSAALPADMPELQPLLAELELAQHGTTIDYDWTYRGKIFHCSVWTETLRNHFALVIRETQKSVFFVHVPTTRSAIMEPGIGAYGQEAPDEATIQSLLASTRDAQHLARKTAGVSISGATGPTFVSAGLTYRLWDGATHAFDDRRD